ncbi:MAG: phosphoribosylaminoimidazolesuccinocarboxamide synthase [Sulfurimonas sp.]|mgnify:FL=1|jgi:phosphoribosylaminoimidazole-succinocarboxamide synthase|uniref:phosphoribosylaminoimidazolesuccinocarboxamide synthase n=1 Tax=unclassified Sulfurimonas TaxID=2623549 RepID=UPI0008BE075D|nr:MULTISPECIES: phosphoribosylaminoimidazolesuccinocarboxamide synthase [unclassified Sulfurimonas]OHE11481.1 MAG: phosphoribosylaminoimidazolesuccinocarboxamide synthase [Sulfurimonas sp. RIFOXYC2_FULL_36_7]MBS4068290.1 phosphoribosylaminoimidazolesuccinocarboxamide synthase [Sulfurimonas sp.]MDD3856241.1 phosphoribosylaminoimidazolesuccinocarboxamide synthase [Sulfurimonas sp.]MDX9755986.1 phosphoribosylaminoimidazolesuccinocarboxamide synthase [Sulfurimonas sp.]OHE04795.1 MAG: phosphoribos
MEKRELLYEGKAKKLFSTDDENLVISEFKDDLTAFNGEKKSSEAGKGALNNKISTELFKLLEANGIKTHFVKMLDDNHMLHTKVDVILIEVIVRNIATGSLSKNLGIKDGTVLPFTLVEFDYKNDALGDPKLNDQHALILGLVDYQDELDKLRRMARQVNDVLKPYFADKGLKLVDFKLEFGKDRSGNIILIDEISPDNCRFWDMESGEKLDKDRFRQGLGGLKVAYEQVLNRILGK